MNKTKFQITKMDCPSEEQLIRMKLEKIDTIKNLDFDIPQRKLDVYHLDDPSPILSALEGLNLDTTLISTETSDKEISTDEKDNKQRKLLWTVLIINFLFFGLEMLFGVFSNSMGLIADSLDMLADSIVYALALFAVGAAASRKITIARFAGYFQIVLAIIGFAEVVRRFIGVEEMPEFQTMISVSLLALLANVLCLYLLQKNKSKEAHMQASMIFTSNDVIINSGVIAAGVLVKLTNSGYPDLIIGAIVFVIVARGAYRILRLD
ncbi:cation transporter [Sphingobacterium sp. UT-1RO-CII-1]|uniref:cation transporter n=1 Tax=Sphingobacterium sp. UT-1RO-CII-1 TaxID=2995225 RepID=UPI00227D18C7|nr:cation transporter [Sphingobacterium sp. UT-1RO-CII-1]MCY4781663.1 cation transporter [Sphingobacterium sp. UT-1RO-CII-1]